ncbi:MAG: SUF system Fe-S cluster assembly regulator [Thiobacillaceae bacterium]|nr:SUF system Fe-S cluster assembly regulator [Thiobacillaceae bacterium]MCX7674137.1 SUF system Fe-S cluster assembly regulator [Thiobacillaceae bacterium]MDW8324793.1 SUF system Fe-S cluster assembly regulator [Burkholderiales bacterium]
MLRIAKMTDYATGLMTHLAHQPQRCVSAQQLAQELSLPAPTVARLLKLLGRAGLVVSQRGKAGGYGLARPAQTISVADIIAAIEGPVALTDCALGDGRCGLEHGCGTRGNWRLINQAVQVALEAVTLADMATPRAQPLHYRETHARKD